MQSFREYVEERQLEEGKVRHAAAAGLMALTAMSGGAKANDTGQTTGSRFVHGSAISADPKGAADERAARMKKIAALPLEKRKVALDAEQKVWKGTIKVGKNPHID